jgi:large subunit ribosomal protein L34
MATKRTYQPKKKKRATTHGFLSRSKTASGSKILQKRRRVGRAKLSAYLPVFSRRERLPRAQFSAALKNGKRVSSPNFLVVIPEEVRGYAVVIPKKVVHLSVRRHQLKRRILEVLRAFSGTGNPLPPALIIFPRSTAGSVNYESIKTELHTLLSHIRI